MAISLVEKIRLLKELQTLVEQVKGSTYIRSLVGKIKALKRINEIVAILNNEPKTTADEDFEKEEIVLENPPKDEAALLYQMVIDGAEITPDLLQKALEYAEKDPEHVLLSKATEVIKNTFLKQFSNLYS